MKTPDWSAFGREVFAEVAERVAIACMGEEDEAIMEIAAKHGIVQSVPYDPALHGEIDAEPGTRIWFWGKQARKEGTP